jgi:polyphosphate:AMP phosphotransferase
MKDSSFFDDVSTAHKISKKEFKGLEPALRMELVDLQQKLRQAGFSVMVVFAGVDGAGKHEMVNLLNAWMDPRGLVTHGYEEPDAVETQRPSAWRYWRDLPADGQIGLYLSAWYSKPLLDRVHRKDSQEEFLNRLADIEAFERTLCDNGVLLLKVWMHLDKKSQRKRLEKLASKPETEWQVKSGAWENWGLYPRFMEASEHIVHTSGKGSAPWMVVDGRHEYSRQIEVAHALRDALKERLEHAPTPKALSATAWEKKMKSARGSLKGMSLDKSLEKEDYKPRLKKAQRRLYQLQHEAKVAGLSTVLVFEGQDAAGKGGAIRRLVQGLDAREYQVIPIAAPTREELAHHYLWRFWLHLPKKGRVTIFDRSWYGRVLVERVEGFASAAQWQQAYREINEFEHQLTGNHTVVCKFWIQIDKEEQLKRFEARQETPYKQWKITDEDWRNREKWDAYDKAVDDMVSLTHTKTTPWVLVEGNNKYWSRIKVIETVCEQIEQGLARMG